MKKKIVILALAFVLVFALGIGGTLAWLTATSDTVTNTFTYGDVSVSLTETFNAKSEESKTENDIWKAQLIPGYTYEKNPKVTVSGNVDCYLFVKFEEENANQNVLSYTSTLTEDNGWTQGTGTGEGKDGVPTNVWYREVKANDTTKSWNLLKDDRVNVPDTLTKSKMPKEESEPKLTYTAYACQLNNSNTNKFTPAEAWAKVNPDSTSSN